MNRLARMAVLWASLAVLALPAVVQAQYTYTVNGDGSYTITGYTGEPSLPSGALSIPSTISGHTVACIGSSAFNFCTALTSVTIPASVTNIGQWVFYACTSLTSITVNASNPDYSSMGGVLFDKNETTLVEFPRGQTNSYSIPNGVTNIAYAAFSGSTTFFSVTIPSSVTIIGDQAFSGCSGLTNATIPNSVTYIGFQAFNNTSLSNVTIPDSVTNIGTSAFINCPALMNVVIGNGVITIGSTAFQGCASLTNVVIGNGVQSIGGYAFNNCTSISSVTIGNGLLSIGDYAFWFCPSLTSVAIPYGVTNIGASAFSGCTSLSSVTIPTSVTSIGDYAFWGCSILSGVATLGSTVNYGVYVFAGDHFSSATIPNGTTNIPVGMFYNCSSLTNVMVGSDVQTVGDYAFNNCTSLAGIYFGGNKPGLGGSSVFVGDHATIYYWLGTTGWTNLWGGLSTIGLSGIAITCTSAPSQGGSVTGGGTYLASANVQLTAVAADGWLFAGWDDGTTNNPRIVTVSTNSTYTAVFERQYTWATNNGTLNITGYTGSGGNVTIPSTINGFPVTSIGADAFLDCGNLTAITIPSSITNIASYAFLNCTSLSNIFAYGNAPSCGSFVFFGDPATLFYVPGTTGWDTFTGCQADQNPSYHLLTVTGGTGGGYFTNGQIVAIGATVSNGWTFAYWTGATQYVAGVTLPRTTVSMPATNVIIFTSYEIATLIVTSQYGSPMPILGSQSYFRNSILPCSVNSPVVAGTTQYVCTGASVSGNTYTQNSPTNITLMLTNAATLTWNWQTQYLLATSTNGSGSVTTGGWFNAESNVTLTATPSGSWSFAGWSGDTNGIVIANNMVTTAMTQARSIQATFVQFTFTSDGSAITITAYTGNGGVLTIPATIFGLPVTCIAGYAFLGSSLSGVTIMANVTNIGNYAFFNCSSLSNIYFHSNAPSLGSFVFSGGTPAAIYYLPNTTGWDTFTGPTPVLWNPTAKPDATFGVQANCFGFTITNAGSPTIIIDACTNLTSGIWAPVSTNTLTGGSSYFSDPAWTNYPGRFYRFRSP